MTELMLTENLLSELPTSVGQLKNMTSFNVDRNQLEFIPKEVSYTFVNSNLKMRNVSQFQFTNIPLFLLTNIGFFIAKTRERIAKIYSFYPVENCSFLKSNIHCNKINDVIRKEALLFLPCSLLTQRTFSFELHWS